MTSLKYADYTVRESKKNKTFHEFFFQVECHIYLPQNELYDACKKLGLAIAAYAPFGSPERYEQLYVLYKYFFLFSGIIYMIKTVFYYRNTFIHNLKNCYYICSK